MKKFFIKIYFRVIILSFILVYFSFIFIQIANLIKYSKENFKNILNIYSNENIESINKQFNVNLSVYNKDKICIYGEDNKIFDYDLEVIKYKYKKLYYIKKYGNYYLCIYKNINLFGILFENFFITIILFVLLAIVVYIFFKKIIYKNLVVPLKDIYEQLPKLRDRNLKVDFQEYKIDEINSVCNEIKNLELNLKNIDSMLKIEKSKINYILDNMNEGFILFDKNKNVLIINKRARKILDCENSVLGENILYYTQNIKIIENIDKVLKTKQKNIFDLNTDDNKIYSIHINKIQKGVFEKYSGVIMLLIDVTAERETQKMRQEFFSNVSHELKTPITSIQGYTELLYNDFAKSREQEKEFLKIIQREITNITNLINNILTISKLENKEFEINKSEVNIKIIVEDIISSTKPMCLEKNINIKNNCEDITIFADYKKIHQLFNNLIVNAIKYNKQNGYVEINCVKTDENIIIIVKDNGIGIPLVDRNRIFERFYRVQKGRSKNDGGTGLGLSIVKHIVKYYNGKIKVKSTEGFGSEFIIKIPI